MLALSPVPFRGKQNMTVQERVKFRQVDLGFSVGRSVTGFPSLPERWVFLSVSNALVLRSSTASAPYRQVLGGTGLALGKLVVPRRIRIPLMKLSEFLQTAY